MKVGEVWTVRANIGVTSEEDDMINLLGNYSSSSTCNSEEEIPQQMQAVVDNCCKSLVAEWKEMRGIP